MIHHGDLFTVLPTLEAESIDACVTDPPYGIGFMGREWDTFKPDTGATRKLMHPRERARAKIESDNPNLDGRWRSPALSPSQIDYDYSVAGLRGFQDWSEQWAREVFRVLKPGAYLVVCGAPRSYHRMACGIEEAGFVVRDCFSWLFLSGFPKSFNFGCKCGGNSLQYNHEDSDSGHDSVRGMRQAANDAAIVAEAGQTTDLFSSVQGGFAGPGLEATRPQGPGRVDVGEQGVLPREDVGREQSSLERGQLHRTGEGLPNDPDAGTPASAGERLRAGAHCDRGADSRTAPEAERGSASSGPRSGEQRSGQSTSLRLPSRTLDDGTSERRAARCERCGGLTAARGRGTALKPCNEPIVIARKPFKGTIENCFIKHGTAALNIDDCRIPFASQEDKAAAAAAQRASQDQNAGRTVYGDFNNGPASLEPYLDRMDLGRWPANTLLESPEVYPEIAPYLYCAKPSREERDFGTHHLAPRQRDESRKDGNPGGDNPRNRGLQPRGNFHPTVKPVDLMRWLVRLVTPIDGIVLDPFMGSGTTIMAARYEHRRYIGIEREADYILIAEARIAAVAPLFASEASA